ncbi:MAG: sialidase family protein [Pirellulaceae bacterium]
MHWPANLCSSLIVSFVVLSPWALRAQAPSELRLHSRVRALPHTLQGPFVRNEDGSIVAVSQADAWTSRDNGRNWEKRPLFSPEKPAAQPIMVRDECALLRTRRGVIIASFMNDREKVWTWKNDLKDAPGAVLPTYAMRSLDGGQTWQDVQKLHDDWTGAVRDMIQTKEGRVVIAAQKMLHNPGRHATITYWSDDDGMTWHASNTIDLGGQGHHAGNMEPTLVELQDGRVWMLLRTNWSEFWSAWSYDGGRNWRVLQPSGIAASSAPAIVKRLASGRLALVWNPLYPEGQTSYKLSGGDGIWSEVPVSNHREELALAFSSDEGRTWSPPVVLARQPGKWLSYPYLFESAPGHLWLTTMQGGLRVEFDEADFVSQ